MTRRLAPLLLLAAFAGAQDDLIPYSPTEIDNLLNTFGQTYKSKKIPEEDAVAALTNLKNAYRYLDAKSEEEITKEEEKLKKEIINVIARKGLFARNRPLVNLECARVLGELRAEDANNYLRRWMEKVPDEKSPNPQWVEYGFQSLAWIGADDRRSLELALDYASKGKHPEMAVAAHAMKACYEWRHLDPKWREEFFEKILGYVEGLYSQMRGGDAKNRGLYEQRYNAVKEEGLKALEELAGGGVKFEDPTQAREWLKENKRKRWEPYTGPRFRKATQPDEKEEGEKEPEKS